MGTDDGGEAGISSGGKGGATTGGSAGTTGGTAGVGGNGAQGGSAGQPQGGTGGQSGSAGNGASGMVGTLGKECSPPGKLACAGNHQKLTVLCGGDNTWQPNETCGTDEYCDSAPGPNVGTCQPVAAGCEDGPGTTFCATISEVVTCTADAVGTTTDACAGVCRGEACRDVPECPVWSDYDDGASCAPECYRGTCMGSSQACEKDWAFIALGVGESGIVRTPWAEDACNACEGTGGGMFDVSVGVGNSSVRVTVPPPWKVQPLRNLDCSGAIEGCAVFTGQEAVGLRFSSSSPEDGPVNILFENVPTSATCPPEGGEGGQPG